MLSNLVSALGMLFTVVLILFLAYWTSRWVASHGVPGPPAPGGGDAFRILARLPVGRGAYLLLVRVREDCLLLGVTEQRVTLLKEWTGEEADAWTFDAPSPDNGFWQALQKFKGR